MLRFLMLMCAVAGGCLAYTYREELDTTSGVCQGAGYGPIPVGQTGYDDERCERIRCLTGMRNVAGCGVVKAPAECRLVRGQGHYPDCCPTVTCEPPAP